MPFVEALECGDYCTAADLSSKYMHEHSVIGPYVREHESEPLSDDIRAFLDELGIEMGAA